MKIGFIGLGRMGSNMVLNLIDNKHKVVIYNRSIEKTKKIAKKGAIPSDSIKEFFSNLGKEKRVIWIMITAGKFVDEIIKNLMPYLNEGDVLIDGGNSYYLDSIKRNISLNKKGIKFLDCGVSGGIKGARNGACMMVGGDKISFNKNKKMFSDMCVKNGYGYMGKSGAGHFVKAIHNSIEYGILGAFNEGFEVLKKEKNKFKFDLKEISKVYDNGSIIQGNISNWIYDLFKKENYLDEISCQVPPGETEKEMGIFSDRYNMKILKNARLMRKSSREGNFCAKLISGVRNKFGGHSVKFK